MTARRPSAFIAVTALATALAAGSVAIPDAGATPVNGIAPPYRAMMVTDVEMGIRSIAATTFDIILATHAGGLKVFSPAGQLLQTWGTLGSDPGEFDDPHGIAVDDVGRIWVVDTGNDRVQLFDDQFEWLIGFGGPGDEYERFRQPTGIGLGDHDEAVVTDEEYHYVWSGKRYLPGITFGSEGTDPGQFIAPRDAAVLPNGNIVVTDAATHGVQVFSGTGDFQFSIVEPSGAVDPTARYPAGVIVDSDGYIYVLRLAPPGGTGVELVGYDSQTFEEMWVIDIPETDHADLTFLEDGSIAIMGNGTNSNPGYFAIFRFRWCFNRRATIVGTDGPDTLHGTAGRDVIVGLAGDDTLIGYGGHDRLCGGPGDDVLRGRGGNDKLLGKSGNDILYGGDGRDVLRGADGDDRLRGGDDLDVLRGQRGSDQLFGGNGPDYLMGGEDADTLVGGAGVDTLYGGAGPDTCPDVEPGEVVKSCVG